MERDKPGEQSKIKERIKFETEVLRLTVVGLLTIGGGMVGLISKTHKKGSDLFFIAFSLALVIILAVFLVNAVLTIKKIIK